MIKLTIIGLFIIDSDYDVSALPIKHEGGEHTKRNCLSLEPIKNPVTEAIHEAQIVLPNGFIFTKGEILNTKECVVNDGPISFNYPGKKRPLCYR